MHEGRLVDFEAAARAFNTAERPLEGAADPHASRDRCPGLLGVPNVVPQIGHLGDRTPDLLLGLDAVGREAHRRTNDDVRV